MKKFLLIAAVAIVGGYFAAKFYVQHQTKKAVDQIIALMPAGVAVVYDDVTSAIDGSLYVGGISVKLADFQNRLAIDAVGIQLPSFLDVLSLHDLPGRVLSGRGELPRSGSFFVDGLTLDVYHDYFAALLDTLNTVAMAETGGDLPTVEADPASYCVAGFSWTPSELGEYGFNNIQASMTYAYEQLDDSFVLSMDFEWPEVYEVQLRAEFQGQVDRVLASVNPRLVINRFSYVVSDNFVTSVTYPRCAKLGVSREAAKAAHLQSIVQSFASAGIVVDDRIKMPLERAIEQEHRVIDISGEPPSPVDLSRVGLYKPEDMPALFGIDITSR
ncbi:MAG: hypothetical protein AAF290_08830 [Pseudomonadota bacterium]